MNSIDTQQELLDQIAEEFASRCRRGEQPAVRDYEERFPALAERLRDLLPPVALIEQLKRDRASGKLDVAGISRPEQLGDYRLVREIGRGGMGIVYEAVQESLGRRVALKLLPQQALANAKRLDRFRREAHAAARLHHTNIVPVFGLFEADDWHFYVMQYIEGESLAALIARLRTNPESNGAKNPNAETPRPRHVDTPEGNDTISDSAAGIMQVDSQRQSSLGSRHSSNYSSVALLGAQAADALGYAHDQGILHRDIKPANLLLDERGTLWVTDFGLAKLAEYEGLTNTGDVLGTLQYMAPESLHGHSDSRSDLYSLGLTLYELLTLEAPFPEMQPGRLVEQINEGLLPWPRQINADIPRDLETIVLTAIARDPAQRYQSAHALAADLRRFVQDEPILARRANQIERLWRWSRRNRALAASGSIALGSLVVAAIVGWLAYVSTTRALGREALKRSEAEAATQRAEANMQLSLNALEEIFTAMAPPAKQNAGPPELNGPPPFGRPGQGPPGRDDPRRLGDGPPRGPGSQREPEGPPRGEGQNKEAEVVRTVLQFYERFAAQNATNSHLKREAARAHRRVGDIHERKGELAEAIDSYRRSCALFAELAAESADHGNAEAELIETQLRQADLLGLNHSSTEEVKLLANSLQTAEQLVQEYPQVSRYRLLLGQAARKRGALEQEQGDLELAEQDYRLAEAAARKALTCADFSSKAAIEVAQCQAPLARLLSAGDRWREAVKVIEASIADLEKCRPCPEMHDALADLHDLLAEILDPTGALPRPSPPPRREGDFPPPGPPRGAPPGREGPPR